MFEAYIKDLPIRRKTEVLAALINLGMARAKGVGVENPTMDNALYELGSAELETVNIIVGKGTDSLSNRVVIQLFASIGILGPRSARRDNTGGSTTVT